MTVHYETDGPVAIVTLDRPDRRNAVDAATADELAVAFRRFDDDSELCAAVLTGANGIFCAGGDLKAMASGEGQNVVSVNGDGPMGVSRMLLSKPVIAAIEGHAVAGGLELAVWADLRVAATDSVFGVFCRRWGVPLTDGGTIRLPRLIGHSHALDMILTGRPVEGPEAQQMGLVNRLVEPGETLATAIELGKQLAEFPQRCLRSDRRSSYDQWGMGLGDALAHETLMGRDVIMSGETRSGATRFSDGAGRHGAF